MIDNSVIKSKEIHICLTITCKLPTDYFEEEDLIKHITTFRALFQDDEVLGFKIRGKLGEPLKGGETCNVINIARHLKS